MAITPLNVFKTIRHQVTTSTVGIYTAPANVASIVLGAYAANVSTGVATVTASHYRGTDGLGEIAVVNNIKIPTNDTLSMIDGKLILETDDEFRISATSNSTVELTLNILETAKQ
ncbi:hypothetical protein KNU05_gp157 [Synechococcus virus S-PRM1]|jgi:hypothetical protein|uniref:Virion structural protein n=1 Tax=Synechococcus virus S-PRM1 TaxID=2100130 RepID=A0A346FK92_9CAUD|nr:hypothetical protein KNU05_gp157 [Synechococcus virus S-PRM1]AXN58397.1 hypothetical protein [Synechococcus virus S-PRM1]